MNKPRKKMKSRWSLKYKKSINCSHPKGFSQRNYCKRQKRGGAYFEGFYEWLILNEDRQMMMFSTRPVELYHGSNTGADNSSLNSFLKAGIKPSIAQGYGQGEGFYVWSDKKSAIHHTKAIAADSITTNAKNDGLPMIITVEAIADPEKWDLDYEHNKESIVDWLYDNFEKLQPLLTPEDKVQLRSKRDMEVFNSRDEKVMSKGVAVSVESFKTLYAQSDSSIRDAKIIGTIINKLQQKEPHTVHKFEELLFANMKPGFALKYVGYETLTPKRIEVFRDNQWELIK